MLHWSCPPDSWFINIFQLININSYFVLMMCKFITSISVQALCQNVVIFIISFPNKVTVKKVQQCCYLAQIVRMRKFGVESDHMEAHWIIIRTLNIRWVSNLHYTLYSTDSKLDEQVKHPATCSQISHGWYLIPQSLLIIYYYENWRTIFVLQRRNGN